MTSALCCFTEPWCAQPEGCVSSFCLRGVGGNFFNLLPEHLCLCQMFASSAKEAVSKVNKPNRQNGGKNYKQRGCNER